jgi:inositol phosphorylceramide mannosyltransferase catalytic subunit
MPEILDNKRLHFIWIGGTLPDKFADNIAKWKQFHPNWECSVWTDAELDYHPLENRALYDQAEKLVPRDAIEQFRADIARYEILYQCGGFYADVDTRPMRNIESALAGRELFAAAEDRNWVGNTYLGATQRHPLFAEVVRQLPANVQRFRGRRPNKLSGPQFLTPLWRAFNGYTAPTKQWFPYSYSHVKHDAIPMDFAPDVYAVHEWNHTRRVLAARKRSR